MSHPPKRTYLSGAKKRKLKKEKEDAEKKNMKLTTLFKVPRLSEGTESKVTGNSGNENASVSKKPDPGKSDTLKIQVVEVAADLQNFSDGIASYDGNLTHPTDRGHFPVDICDMNLKRVLLKGGPCKPQGPFPRDEKNRSFSLDYYHKNTTNGQKIPRQWLCYSEKLDVAYCEPCWLFADRCAHSYNSAWARGINDWQGFSKKIKEHELTQCHLYACVTYGTWKNEATLDTLIDSDWKQKVNFWKDVLRRIIDVTLTLASSNLAFRGHREVLGEPRSGNFLAIIELLSRYDQVLSKLLHGNKTNKITYLSPEIQNELISMISTAVQKDIISEILESQFYSIILDTTQDIAKHDQLSQIFRYVTVVYDLDGLPMELKINESFLGFMRISDGTAEGLVKEIIKSIEEKGLSLKKCRGQGYDGAKVMCGVYSGVQERIRQIERNAIYIHCASHNLNLVLNDAAKVPQVTVFYDYIQRIYVFFSNSIKRWEILEKIEKKHKGQTRTLKKLCPTRWSSRHDALAAVRFRYSDIMKSLSYLILTSKKSDERNEAAALKKFMETYEFTLHTVIQSKIIETTDLVAKCLQSPNLNISAATEMLGNAVEVLQEFRNQFDEIKKRAAVMANSWGTESEFVKKRKSRSKKFFDEIQEDERLTDPEESFKVNVFYSNLDIVIAQIKNRFSAMNDVVKKFQFLHPANLIEMSDDQLFTSANNLVGIYSDDLSHDFPRQLLSLRTVLKGDILKIKNGSIKDLAELLIIKHFIIMPSVPDVSVALKLFLTLPVTVSSAERSFSKLKLVKNYARNSMMQNRLSALSLISIEVERARKTDIDKIVEEFALKNAKRAKTFLRL